MIRYYAYYSCGGYKDLYLGCNSDNSGYTYFLPLLPIWKTHKRAGYTEKLKQVEGFQQIEAVTQNAKFDFPDQARVFFSHGGYRVIYQTLHNGDTCFCVRDVTNGSKDEENRDTPFTILITASGGEDVKRLDNFAVYYLEHIRDLYELTSTLFSYEPLVNGLKFNLAQMNQSVSGCQSAGTELVHQPNQVLFMVVEMLSMSKKACGELGLSSSQIALVADSAGNKTGALPFLQSSPQSGLSAPTIEESTTVHAADRIAGSVQPDNPGPNEVKSPSDQHEAPVTSVNETEAAQPSVASPSESVDEIRESMKTLKSDMSAMLPLMDELKKSVAALQDKSILDQLVSSVENLRQSFQDRYSVGTDTKVSDDNLIIPKAQIWRMAVSLALGILLGALLF